METITSDLQQRFPLSGKKFKKKMLQSGLSFFILSVILTAFPMTLIGVFIFTSLETVSAGVVVASILGCFILIYGTIMAVYSWYVRQYIKTYFYDLDESFITIKKGVIMPVEIHVQYQKIQDVYVDQDVWDRMLGIYDVHISSATVSSGMEAHIDGLDYEAAEGIKNLLLQFIKTGYKKPENAQAGSDMPQKTVLTDIASEISEKTYPISKKWVLLPVFNRLLVVLLAGPIIYVRLFEGLVPETKAAAMVFIIVVIVAILESPMRSIIWRKNFKFNFSPDRIFMYTSFFVTEEKNIPYDTIQDVTISQSFAERLFGLATVTIENASGAANYSSKKLVTGLVIPGQSPEKANEIAQVLRTILAKRNTSTSTGI